MYGQEIGTAKPRRSLDDIERDVSQPAPTKRRSLDEIESSVTTPSSSSYPTPASLSPRKQATLRNVTGLQSELTATSPQPKPGETVDVSTGEMYKPSQPFHSPKLDYKPEGIAPRPQSFDNRTQRAARTARQIEDTKRQAVQLFRQADQTPDTPDATGISGRQKLRAQAEGKVEGANELARRAQKQYGDLLEIGFGKDTDPNSRRQWAYAKAKTPTARAARDTVDLQAANAERFANPRGQLNQALTPAPPQNYRQHLNVRAVPKPEESELSPEESELSPEEQNALAARHQVAEEARQQIAAQNPGAVSRAILGAASVPVHALSGLASIPRRITGTAPGQLETSIGALGDVMASGAQPTPETQGTFSAGNLGTLAGFIPTMAVGGRILKPITPATPLGSAISSGAQFANIAGGEGVSNREMARQGLIGGGVGAASELAGGAANRALAGKLANAELTPAQAAVAGRVAQGAAGGGAFAGQSALMGQRDPETLAKEALLGAAMGAAHSPRFREAQEAARQQGINDIRQQIDRRSAMNEAALRPQEVSQTVPAPMPARAASVPNAQEPTEALTGPLASATPPSAIPRLPAPENFNARRAKLLGMEAPPEVAINEQIQTAEKLLNSQNEGDQQQGRAMMRRALSAIRQSEGYLNEANATEGEKPYTAARAAIEQRLKPAPTAQPATIGSAATPVESTISPSAPASIPLSRNEDARTKAVQFEQQAAEQYTRSLESGRFRDAQDALRRQKDSLAQQRRLIDRRTPEGQAEYRRLGDQMQSVQRMQEQTKTQARTAAKQANAQTAPLSKKLSPVENQEAKVSLNQPVESTPLLRPEAVQNPEGGVPVMPEQTFSGRLERGIRRDEAAQANQKPAKRLLSRIAELGGIDERHAGELQDVKDARRIGVIRKRAEMSPDVLARQLQSEGYDVDPENLNTLWEAARRDIVSRDERASNTADLNQKLADEEAAHYANQEPFAPSDESAYISQKAYDQSLRSTYFGDGRELSSTENPQTAPIPPLGSWMIDDGFKALDGREVHQLISVPVDNIEISEDSGPQKWGSAKQYAKWLQEGKEAPPIRLTQTEQGRLKTMDHRRLMAAKAVGQKEIKAWVSWTTKSDRSGNPAVGLTYELAQKGHQPIPIKEAREEYKIFPGDAKALERIKKELATEQEVSPLRRAIADSDERGHVMPEAGRGLVSMSPYNDLVTRNQEAVDRLYEHGMASPEGKEIFQNLRQFAQKEGIEPRHLHALADDVRNHELEKARWADKGLDLSTIQSADTGINQMRESALADAKNLPENHRTAIEREVAALDSFFNDPDAVNLLERVAEGDHNATDGFNEKANEHGISADTASELIGTRRPSPSAIRSRGQAENGARQSIGARPQENQEARPATPDEFDLLNRNPATIPNDEFDAHLQAMEKLRNDEIRGIVKLSREDKREMFRQLRNVNEERKYRVQRKELPAKFEPRTFPIDKELMARSIEKATQPKTGENAPSAPKAREQKTPGFFSQLSRVIDQKMPAKASAQQVRNIIENPQSGIKPDEVKWTGLDDYLRGKETVTKAEVQEFLKANQVDVQEVTKGQSLTERTRAAMRDAANHQDWRRYDELQQESDTAPTKYGKYTLPGAKEGSYRELLLTLPEQATYNEGFYVRYPDESLRDSFENKTDAEKRAQEVGGTIEPYRYVRKLKQPSYKSSHFDEPNILAHIRFNERTDAEGKKVLHVEEIQSDWHQEGRKKGYDSTGNKAEREAAQKAFEDFRQKLQQKYGLTFWGRSDFHNSPDKIEYDRLLSAIPEKQEGVPDAPFKKNWHELAFKRALRYAAEHGYDKMTWTTGEQQAERFDLSKQVDRIVVSPRTEAVTGKKTKSVAITFNDSLGGGFGSTVRFGVNEKGVIDNVDNIKYRSTIGKPLDEVLGKELSERIMGAERATLEGEGLKIGGEGMKGFYDQILPAFANKYAKKWGARVGEAKIKTGSSVYEENKDLYGDDFPMDFKTPETSVHSIDITPAMRESVMQGQALFQHGQTEAPTASQSLADAKIQFKSGKRGQAGTLYANEPALDVMRAAYEEVFGNRVEFSNVNLNAPAARRMAKVLTEAANDPDFDTATQRRLREVAREFDAASRSGETVSIVSTAEGRKFSDIKVSRRHELFHDAQEGLQNSPGFLAKHKYSEPLIEGLAHYAPEDRTVEAAAFIAGGQAKDFGLTEKQGNEFLEDYFNDIVKTNGPAALKRFFSVAPLAVETLQKAKEKYGIQGQTGKNNSGTARTGDIGRSSAENRPSREGEGVLRPAQPGRSREQRRIRASFGELETEPRGQIAASGLGGLQNLFNRKPSAAKPAQVTPLPKNWNLANWSQRFYREAMAAGLSKADRANFAAAKTPRDKNAVLMGATIDPKHEQAVFDVIDKADSATTAKDGSALYDAMVDATNMLRHKPTERGYERFKKEAGNAISLPRALMASADISAPLRQGAILTLPPTQWGKAAKATVRMFESFSTKQYERISKEINLHPDAETARDSGLYLSTDKSGLVTKKEEDFISHWADKIPIVKHSEQAYKAYLDSLRMDTFARYKKSIDKTKGLSAEQKENGYKAAANWINVATGRGTLGETFENAMPALSKVMFAPRYTASRIQVLNPMTYAKNMRTAEGRAVLKNQMSDLVQYAGVISATLALAAANGAQVGLNPDDPDFLKIKVGNIRYDTLAGLQQPMRLFYRMGKSLYGRATGQKVNSRESALDIASRFGRSKLAPIPSFFVDYFSGRDFTGQPFKPSKAVIDRVVPLMWKDFYDAYQTEGLAGGLKTLPGATGIGVQNYGEKPGTLKPSAFTREASQMGKNFELIKPKANEPDDVFNARKQRVEGWMSTYGDKLINNPRYSLLTEDEKKAAIKLLRDRIGRQQNLKTPKLATFEPNAVLLGVKKSQANKPKQARKQLWTPNTP